VKSFWNRPTERALKFSDFHHPGIYGSDVSLRVIWTSAMTTVWVDHLRTPIPPKSVKHFLRNYLPTASDGHWVSRFGFPAATEIEPDCDGAGQCHGTVASLLVLDGTTLYTVFTVQSDPLTAGAIIDSFRLVH
jgi:hypothetical protein